MSNDNSGALFRNDRKEKDTHPDHTGTATINGVDFWISAWVKEKNGKKYFSLAFKPKDQQAERAAPKPAQSDLDDEIPF